MTSPEDESEKGKSQTSQEALVLRVDKWEIRADNKNYTIGYRDDPDQRYLYQMAFVSTLDAALKNLSHRILKEKFIKSKLPETQRTLATAIETIEAHDEWWNELTMGY